MSIDRLPSKKWRVRWRDQDGKQRSRAFSRKADAQGYEQAIERARQTGRLDLLDADLQTLAELAAEHMAAVRPDLSDATWATYRALWAAHVDERVLANPARQWSHELASLTLRQLTPEAVERWRDDRLDRGAGRESVRKTMALVQTIVKRAVKYGRIPSNPVELVSKPSAKRDRRVHPVAPAGIEKLRANLDQVSATMVSVLAYSGVRPGEARALQWGDIGTKTIFLYGSKTDTPRTVRLLAPLRDDLAAWRKFSGSPPDDAYIFARADGEPWTELDYRNWRRRKFAPAVRAAKLKISRPYDLRHSAASLWLHEGVNPVQVASWLGHSPAILLGTYAHVVAELDPAVRANPEVDIRAARRDTSMTHRRVNRGQRRARAKAAT